MATLNLTGNETFSDLTLTNYIVTDNGVGNNTLTLGDGTDQVSLDSSSNTIKLGNGTDSVTGGIASNTFTVGTAADTNNILITVFGANNTITTAGTGTSTVTTGAGGNNTITVGMGSATVTLGDTASGNPDTVSSGAGDTIVNVSADALSGDTIMGATSNLDGTTNRLVLTSFGTMSPVNVSGFASYTLANGGANSLTLSSSNFSRLPGNLITVFGGNSGNTVNASALSAPHSVTIHGGAGIDILTGGGGNDRFVFAASNLSGDMVDGGTGTNTLELAAGGPGSLAGLGTNFVNISTVLLDPLATWTIGINSPTAFTGKISGFIAGDRFDLANLAFNSAGTVTLGVNNQLQITEGGTTYNINLDPTENFTGDFFHLARDGHGGTLVTENFGVGSPLPPSNDFYGTASSDLLWQNTDGTVAIWEMNGATVLADPVVANPGTAWQAVGSGDFNHDGHADILWQNTDGTVAIWEMNGATVLADPVVANPGTSWQVVGTGNFTGDGYADDILWRNTDGTVAIWEMNGATVTADPVIGNPGTSWNVAGTGDFYNNGSSDILWQNTDGTVAIWEMNGATVIADPVIANPGTSWKAVGTGDFYGNGYSDILWQNTDGTVAIWEMKGATVVADPVIGNPGTSWKAVGTGDYYGDGYTDILFRSTTGAIAIWKMNGATVTADPVIGNPGTAWHPVLGSGTGTTPAGSTPGAGFGFGDITVPTAPPSATGSSSTILSTSQGSGSGLPLSVVGSTVPLGDPVLLHGALFE